MKNLERSVCIFALALALCASSCSSGGGSDGGGVFVVNSTDQGIAGTSKVVVSDEWLVYQADEATTGGGTDLNGDGDMTDAIAAVVDMTTGTEQTLDVAARELYVLDNEVFLVVDESADGRLWNPDGDMSDRVLLHWSSGAAMPVFVEELDNGGAEVHAAVAGTRLYFSSASNPVAGESSLMFVTAAAPTAPQTVLHTDAANPISPSIGGVEEDLIFLTLDEVEEGRDLNGDGDMTDGNVLALLDGTNASGMIRSTMLAVPDDDGPFAARATGTSDWLVAFFVSEADQDGMSLNDSDLFAPAWLPSQCNANDVDATDEVLHFLNYAMWNTNQVLSPPINTGLSGDDRIVVTEDFVGVVTDEADQNNCDLNADGDMTDEIVMWAPAASPVLPVTDESQLLAIDNVAGGVHGFAELDGRFVIVVSESDEDEDINNDGDTNDELVGWHDPQQGGMAWQFDHDAAAPMVFVGSTFLAETPELDRVLVALREDVFGDDINNDGDENDSVPTFGCFGCQNGNPNDMDFPGVAVALDTGAAGAGIVLSRSQLYYRVDEVEDENDWNEDGDENDLVLLRTSVSAGTTAVMGASSNLAGAPAIETDGMLGAAFIASEAMEGADLNNDGDMTDHVLRWFRVS